MLIPVILSGGAGTRLWPVSREGHPKPFMKLADGESLLLKTYRRAVSTAAALGFGSPELLTVTNRDYYFMSKDELAAVGIDVHRQGTFLLEPMGRNTAPAVALAAHLVAEKYGPDAVMLVLPADHLIDNQERFMATVADAVELAENGNLVTFGMVPQYAETGFGYIEAAESVLKGHRVKRFIEKPTLDAAEQYVDSGHFFWNSGMFCFKAGFFLQQLRKCAPDVADGAQVCWDAIENTQAINDSAVEIPVDELAKMPDISVDYAVMERSTEVAVMPSDFGWSDIGSWRAISELVKPDENDNRIIGDAITLDSNNNFIQSEDRLVAAIGISGLFIIDTKDALLVANRENAQDVKKIVSKLKEHDHDACKLHRTVARPWGTYTVLEEGPRFKIKRIEVKSGASLSLQMHHHRSEHWIVVSGMAKVVNGEREIYVRTNESTYIPAGHKHRLENPGICDLVMIEVQSGEYLGEDDIVRFEDQYGRAADKSGVV